MLNKYLGVWWNTTGTAKWDGMILGDRNTLLAQEESSGLFTVFRSMSTAWACLTMSCLSLGSIILKHYRLPWSNRNIMWDAYILNFLVVTLKKVKREVKLGLAIYFIIQNIILTCSQYKNLGHFSHFKNSISTFGWWLPYWIVQL